MCINTVIFQVHPNTFTKISTQIIPTQVCIVKVLIDSAQADVVTCLEVVLESVNLVTISMEIMTPMVHIVIPNKS